MTLPRGGGSVLITYEYEKLRKKCFHYFWLTHEKATCPLLRKSRNLHQGGPHNKRDAADSPQGKSPKEKGSPEGPPGFPPLFPELPREERQMEMMTSGVQGISFPGPVGEIRPIIVSFALEKEEAGKGRFYFDKRMIDKVGIEEAICKG
ncbi:unnamed protein product [Thlaspi arvense]|uniref:Zinc knuckle CX2CX4HX4C domain-containing protein n=1 Tax=Thlaspi arvense TaxID=13288 RepID=A0AAU9SFW8_THLAR|nr:unnamed protein product [Thlaspi arvense]